MRASRRRQRFSCPHPKCPNPYSTRTALKIHYRSVHAGQRVPCPHPTCSKLYESQEKANVHYRAKHTEQHLSCPYYGYEESFSTIDKRRKHYISEYQSSRSVFWCTRPTCTAVFVTQKALETHSKVYQNLRLSCPDTGCSKVYASVATRNHHYKMQHSRRKQQVECLDPVCKKTYKSSVCAARHYKEKHQGNNSTYTLSITDVL